MIRLTNILNEDDLVSKYSSGKVLGDKTDQPEDNFLDYEHLSKPARKSTKLICLKIIYRAWLLCFKCPLAALYKS